MIVPVVVPLFLSAVVAAALPEGTERVADGVELYEQGRFAEALAAFDRAAAEGADAAVAAYNRGNCLLRLGREGGALHAYLVAERHRPRQPAIEHNIGVVQARLGGERSLPSRFDRRLQAAVGRVSPAEYRSIGAFLAILFCLLAARAFRRGRGVARRWVALLLAPAMLAYLLSLPAAAGPRGRVAVVVRDAVLVRGDPSPAGAARFSLQEGEIVAVLERRAGWLRIEERTGHRGWVDAAHVPEVGGR